MRLLVALMTSTLPLVLAFHGRTVLAVAETAATWSRVAPCTFVKCPPT